MSKTCRLHFYTHFIDQSTFFLLCLIALMLTACSGSGGSGSVDPGQTDNGDSELLVALTDAEGDFLTYLVKIDSVTLTRSNGATVETLPGSTEVDFAQYVDVTELLSVSTVPAGRYDSATVTLDFSEAQITVQDELGNPVAADAVDNNGNPLTTLNVVVEFADRDRFVVRRGVPAQITLDFDLDASNTISLENGAATVTVDPVFLADAVLEEPKAFRLRGILGQVSVEEGRFSIDLQPFRRRIGQFGAARVHVNGQTQYEINGQMVAGEDGLAALQALGAGNPMITEGEWDRIRHRYTARYVYAGNSVSWNEADILRGTVTARSGRSVSVRGALIEMADGRYRYNDDVTVSLGDNTRVLIRAALDREATIADISVGSAVFVSGEMVAENDMDATEGYVRVHLSHVSGSVVAAGPLSVDLGMINGRRIDLYDFTGTGIDADNDADPDGYEVDTASLNLSGILPGDPVRLSGLVTEYGSAPEDFIAHTIVDSAGVRGHLVLTYGIEGAATAIGSLDDAGILFSPDNSAARHHISRAGIVTDLKELATMPLIVPGGERGVYAISVQQRTRIYTYYRDFVEALTAELNTGALVSRFDARGYYNSVEAHFTSLRFGVKLANGD